jgi:hypothetical protein
MTSTADTLVPEPLWQATQPLLPIPLRHYGGRLAGTRGAVPVAGMVCATPGVSGTAAASGAVDVRGHVRRLGGRSAQDSTVRAVRTASNPTSPRSKPVVRWSLESAFALHRGLR